MFSKKDKSGLSRTRVKKNNFLNPVLTGSLNPFNSDGLYQTYWYNDYGIVHLLFEGVPIKIQ